MRRTAGLVGLVLSLAVLGSAAPAGAANTRLVGYMYGANEVPGPGDPDGVGRAVVTVDTSAAVVCVVIQFANIALPATGFHIHRGAAGTAGPVVIPFALPSTNQSSQCVQTNTLLASDIAANPSTYYINIHNSFFPSGAARGQLQPG